MPARVNNGNNQLIELEHARINNGNNQLIDVHDALVNDPIERRLINVFTKLGAPVFTRFDMNPRYLNDALGGTVIMNWTITNSDSRSLIRILENGYREVIQTTDGSNAFPYVAGNISSTSRGYRKSPAVGSTTKPNAYVDLISDERANTPNTNSVIFDSNVAMRNTMYVNVTGAGIDWDWTLQHIATNADGSNTYESSPANLHVLNGSYTLYLYEDEAHTIPISVEPDNPNGMLATNGVYSETAPMQNADYIITASNSVASRRVHKEFYRWTAPGVELQSGDESSAQIPNATILHIPITITRSGNPLPAISLSSSLGTHVPALRNFNAGNAESITVILARTIAPGSQPQTDTITANASIDLPSDVSPNPAPRTATDSIDITWSGFNPS